VRVQALPTHYGPLDYELRREGPGRLRISVGGHLELPPGGIVLAPPLGAPLRRVEVNGKEAAVEAPAAFTLRELPAQVLLAE
jgi:hypothetical protein